LRGFLAEGLYISSKAIKEEDITRLNIGDIYASVEWIYPVVKLTAPVSTTSENLILKSVVSKLRDIVMASNEMNGQLKALCSDVTLNGSPYDMWAHYADAIDTDSAKVAFFSMIRYFLAEDQQRTRQVSGIIEDLVEVLEKAGFGNQ
jgi:regulatory protein YycI of two-component signal transduction system YycFG